MITAEKAKVLTEHSMVIKAEVEDIKEMLSEKIRENSITGLYQLSITMHSFGDYHISEKNLEVRKQVVNSLEDNGYKVITEGLDHTSNPYLLISWE